MVLSGLSLDLGRVSGALCTLGFFPDGLGESSTTGELPATARAVCGLVLTSPGLPGAGTGGGEGALTGSGVVMGVAEGAMAQALLGLIGGVGVALADLMLPASDCALGALEPLEGGGEGSLVTSSVAGGLKNFGTFTLEARDEARLGQSLAGEYALLDGDLVGDL